MDYKELDSIKDRVISLTREVKTRHGYIDMLNRTREPGSPEITHTAWIDGTIQKELKEFGKRVRTALLEPLAIAEAGQPLPDFVRDCITRLNTVAPLLSYDKNASYIWANSAGQILVRLAPYMAQESPKTAKIEEPRAPLCIPTTKSREELSRIFNELVKGGFIAGSAPEALPDFLNAFATQESQSPQKQGRITWVWTARNGQVSPLQMLDFATQVAGRGNGPIKTVEDRAFLNAVNAIFSVKISKGVLDRFNNYSVPETASKIALIIDG